jgi:hypothetical protein
VRAADAPRAAADLAKEFAFDRLILETAGATPRACLQFTRPLDDSGKTNYADYVRVSPGEKAAVTVDGSSLCIGGLAFDSEYRARVRTGAPAKSGERLKRQVDVTIAFGDKPAYVGFAGDGVVLPRFESDGLGIETVNVEKVRVEIFRVADRALARKSIAAGESASENDYLYVYGDDDGEDVGVRIFEKEIAVKKIENATATTVFPFGAALSDLKPGAYFVRLRDASAGADQNRAAQSWRWILYTDIALSTYSSGEGIDVFARSLSTGKPLANVELDLIAENNEILGQAKTDGDGRARFEREAVNGDYPLVPAMLMAYGAQDDFAALDLGRSPLDLSDRNVDGRGAPSVVDGYLWLDRGVYRPGETVRLSGMLRDAAGVASERPVTLKIYRPNYTEALVERIEKFDVGAFTLDFAVPKSAARGQWRIEASADGVGVVASEAFSVEDFVPQRLEVKVSADESKPIAPGEMRAVAVEARYLYGAPAGSLDVEGEARLRIDPNPFPALAGYSFGPVDNRFDERFLTLAPAKTDAAGKASLALNADTAPKGFGAPLRADIVVGVVEPGGRVVRESARVPVRPDARYLGLKLAGDGYGFSQNEAAKVSAVLVDRNGARAAADLTWKIVEEDYWFDWYRQDGEWRWRRSHKDILVAEGRATTNAGTIGEIAQSLDQGSYRISVVDPKSKARSELRFYVGWRSYESGAETPDQATLTLTSKNLKPGDKAKFFLDPPYEGEAIIAVATDRVHSVQRIKLADKGAEITVPTDAAWGAGFYVLATIVTPRDAVERPIPRRAMGVAYAPFDMATRTLGVEIDMPEIVRPRQKQTAPIRIAGAAAGEKVLLTVAAVDEGILRLTKFASPDPVKHYYGKKALGVSVRDDYGRILNANLGAAQRFGGDQLGGEGLTVVPVKSIALFEGPVTVGANGVANVPLDIPDFNGELRVMTVAWSKDKIGSDSEPLTVRDPAPALLSMPRFLGPNDEAQATLLIDNVEAGEGAFNIALAGRGPVSTKATQSLELKRGQQSQALFPIKAGAVGVGGVSMSVAGPSGFSVKRNYPIEVRTPWLPQTTVRTSSLEPGQSLKIDNSITDSYVAGSTAVSVSFSRLKGVDPGPLLSSLYRYPYGCSEQLTSTAMPLLYVNDLGAEIGAKPEYAVRPRVQDAVNKLLNRQGADGAFGLWGEGDSAASPWLGAYVTDFLMRAKEAGYGVPDAALDKSFEALAKIARFNQWVYVGYNMQVYEGPWTNDTTEEMRRRSAAYALYVLAKAGRADLSDLRYFHDAELDKTPSPLARAHVGAALALMGDRARATSAFGKARAALGYQNTGDYYQTSLRDVAGVLSLIAGVQNASGVNEIADAFTTYMKEPDAMHTQEKAFVLLAAKAMLEAGGPVSVTRNGAAFGEKSPAPRAALAPDDIAKGLVFENAGSGPVYASVSVYGSPKSAPASAAQGLEISKRIVTRDGAPANLAAVKQNDRYIVILSGRAASDRVHPSVVVDLLPAGFEIEAVLQFEDGVTDNGNGPYPFVGRLSWPSVAEARDDRFVAAIDLVNRNDFTLAYLVRAVTPGSYQLPGAVIEDMYRPGVFGRTAPGSVKIAPATQ